MKIWTDGGCRENGTSDALGAWAFVADDGAEGSGVLHSTTNNRAELQAVIEALKYALSRLEHHVTIVTDSQLTVFCGNGKWKKKANLDLWREFDALKKRCECRLEWVRGHSGHSQNERCDRLCTLAMESVPAEYKKERAASVMEIKARQSVESTYRILLGMPDDLAEEAIQLYREKRAKESDPVEDFEKASVDRLNSILGAPF